MKFTRNILVVIILYLGFPLLANAATSLSASTQNPVVGESFFIQLNIDYGVDKLIGEAHYMITYDASVFEFESIVWTQTKADYHVEPGVVYIDKLPNTKAWEYGGQVQIRLKTLRSSSVQIKVLENGRAKYDNGAFISQYFSGVTINSVNPSTNSELSVLYVENFEMLPTFTKENKEYNLNVPASVTEVNVAAKKSDDKQRITGLGKRVLNYGANRIDVVVYAQDGSTSSYRIMVYREDDRTGDVSLNSILVNNKNILNGEEDKNKDTYTTVVGRSTDSIVLTAQTTDPKATLIGTGTKSLNMGENVFILRVDTTNNVSKEYKIIVRRSEEEIQPDILSSKLTRLAIENYALDLSNDKNTFLYGVSSDKEEIKIDTVTESSTAKVEINGNTKLQAGPNVVEIKVTETNEEVSEYKIIVYKKVNALEIDNLSNISNNGNAMIYTRSENDNSIIDKDTMEILKNNNNLFYYDVDNMYNGLLYQLKFNSYNYEEIDTKFIKDSDSDNTFKTSIPEGIEMQLYVGDLFDDNTVVKVYTYNERSNYKLLTDGVSVNFGYVTFKTNGDSNYVFTLQTLIKEQTGLEKFFNQYKMFIFGVIFVVLILIILSVTKKKKKKPEELSY